ncbi:hypothetical protein IT399_01605 [Candidatus Nomurabacteria bacterium]|nr:hypothetical protein [Candidatus Nomurabacteria bacterium]
MSSALHCGRVDHEVIANQNRTVVDVGLPMPPKGKAIAKYLEEVLGVSVSEA